MQANPLSPARSSCPGIHSKGTGWCSVWSTTMIRISGTSCSRERHPCPYYSGRAKNRTLSCGFGGRLATLAPLPNTRGVSPKRKASDGIRTCNIFLTGEAFFQLNYTSEGINKDSNLYSPPESNRRILVRIPPWT